LVDGPQHLFGALQWLRVASTPTAVAPTRALFHVVDFQLHSREQGEITVGEPHQVPHFA